MKPPPIVFVSYSHDSEEHLEWVLQLATRLRSDGVDTILDRWKLSPGQDLAVFMEEGLSSSHRVLCICSQAYVDKADAGRGGVGYEKQIITAELLADLNQDRVIPVIRNNPQTQKLPRFLGSRLYIDFEEDNLYESKYEELLRALLDEPLLPVPELGKSPFETTREYAEQRFIPGSETYVSPAPKGIVTFDYSNNDGKYSIGSDAYMFETKWSKASDRRIHVYNDPPSILTVALVKDKQEISSIDDARIYDGSSRDRSPNVGQIVLLQNTNGLFAALKILDIKDDTRGSQFDELTFEYVIQTNGTPDFTEFS